MKQQIAVSQDEVILEKKFVEQFMLARFHAGVPPIEETANYFNTNREQLEYMIRLQGSSYNQLQEEVTKSIAADLISRNELDITQISLVLGFCSYDQFKSSLRIWYNVTN